MQVRLLRAGREHVVECDSDLSILDHAARQGLQLSAVCRAGSCCTCVGKLVQGTPPDQSEQSYLSADDLTKGYLLLCVAYANGPCTIEAELNEQYLAEISGLD